MYPFPDGAGVFQVVVEHRVANFDVEVQEAHNLGYYRRHLHAMVRRKAEKRKSVAYSIRFTDAFNLCQYGLTSSQPHGGVKVARRSVVWTVALNLIGFTKMKHMVVRD